LKIRRKLPRWFRKAIISQINFHNGGWLPRLISFLGFPNWIGGLGKERRNYFNLG